MEELIKISFNENGERVVSAKELYLKLGYDLSQWSRWYKKNIEDNDFAVEFQDWVRLDIVSNGNPTKDFAICLDFAKRICMMARTAKGEECRNYFIYCERVAKGLDLSYENALSALGVDSHIIPHIAKVYKERDYANQQLVISEQKIEQDKPKVVFADSVIGSSNSILVRQFAKDLCDDGFETGEKRLYEWFRTNKYLNDKNEPYQNYVSMGLFEVITRSIGSGSDTFTSKTTKITGKGAVYFAEKIKNDKNGK